jgi:short-subunit dehydrogenase
MPQSLVGLLAVVTGASSGIGAATAHELARRGARVVLAARRADELEAQVRIITAAGGHAVAFPTDITDIVQIDRLVEHVQGTFGRIDVLVNNAGINWVKPVAQTSTDEMNHLVQVNLLGTMLMTRAVLSQMQQRRDGAIIMVGSVASHVALDPLYSAAKFGVRGFSLALRRQLVGSGISISLVTPGNIRTRMTSSLQERMPGPELIARTIADLIIRPRRETIIPFKYHAIVGLDQFFPGIADFLYHWRHRHDKLHQEAGDGCIAEASSATTL